MAGVDLLVSSDRINYSRWAEGLVPQQTSAVFKGRPGATYRFTSVARDHAGNPEPTRTQPDITVTIPPPAPVIQSAGFEPDGRFRLTARGSPNIAFEVEASDDLTGWFRAGVATADAEGRLEFIDPDPSNPGQRFYRLRVP